MLQSTHSFSLNSGQRQWLVLPAQLQKSVTHTQVSWLFLRGLALIYFAAFASMLVQIDGLIGSHGILPIRETLTAVAEQRPDSPYLGFPTVFWFDASDLSLKLVCGLGLVAAVLLLLNIVSRIALVLCYLMYLSIVQAGQDFTTFQWDSFLLETGFIAIFLTWGSTLCVLMFRWLLARFMFMGGIVKVASGDPAWTNLSALSFHYQTQPLPSPLAYYAHFLPYRFNQLCTFGVLVIELAAPFLVFFPRRYRLFAAWSFIALQSGIILTGNYTFFNLLTLLLCLFLFEDRDLKNCLPYRVANKIPFRPVHAGLTANTLAALWLCLSLLTCSITFWKSYTQRQLIEPLNTLLVQVSIFSLVNQYGPFAVMTTTRPEIIIQGSNDGRHWIDYPFKYKPGDLKRGLSWNIPHQPRLDWQLWFAALRAPEKDYWFTMLIKRILEGSPQVPALFAANPFPEKPPVYVQALLYRYYYSTPQQRADTGQLWQRDYLGELMPPTRL